FLRRRPIEIRPVAERDWLDPKKAPPLSYTWFRAIAPLPDDPALHRAVLSFASDMSLLGTSSLPHAVNWFTPNFQSASLDHAVWLHEPFRADEWLLYATDSPWAGHARGFNRGRIFTRDGRLVASTAQEGLMRVRG
ncbi:MAG TPA: acyl-CoA thioesterase II, partial [Sphingomonas sp.]|nr:acyl-CoA thioesterase II [Sphingomonas sp.]